MKNKEKEYKNITFNKKVKYNYFIYKEIEAGIVLKGWEIKSIRLFRVNIDNSYVSINNDEAYLIGARISPLKNIFSHVKYNPVRNRKLLLNRFEIYSLFGKKKNKGYSVVTLSMYIKRSWCKVKIAVVKGKKKYDKRVDIKNKEWNLSKNRILKKSFFDFN